MYVEATARIQMWTEAQCYTEILYWQIIKYQHFLVFHNSALINGQVYLSTFITAILLTINLTKL